MIVRTDHVVGGIFVVFGFLILGLSGDLPVGTLSFPGAGLMPKLLAGLLVLFGLALALHARRSEPLANLSWRDLPHAVQVAAITALAVAFYQSLGFALSMGLLLFALTFAVERRHPVSAAAFSAAVVALTYLLFTVALKTPVEQGPFGF
ncbi:MAG: putative tricarboxylic transport rane protein [Alphaproteobacteria bacterium]|nr:putative tricarboxylic transport rane protein [Alphaproteobacteria bacterium]